MHEYTVKGHPKEKVLFYLATFSIFVAPHISEFLQSVLSSQLNETIHISISTVAIFAIIYALFNKFAWKCKMFSTIMHYPNLNGNYNVTGLSLQNPTGEKVKWDGEICINQTWDKIVITLKTANSTSKSLSVIGGIRYIPHLGYQLSYHYENYPDATQGELRVHEGFCTLDFEETLEKAEGCYFNNIKSRASYGKMELERV